MGLVHVSKKLLEKLSVSSISFFFVLIAMNLVAMASTRGAMASNLVAVASNRKLVGFTHPDSS